MMKKPPHSSGGTHSAKEKAAESSGFFPAGHYARPASRIWLKKKISLL
jgi:hypothetical protein